MIRAISALVLALGFFAGGAAAQERITPGAFLDRVVGKTVIFRVFETGEFAGVEQFLRRDLSVWADDNGRCTYGEIVLRGPLICFVYRDMPEPDNCWMPFDSDGALLVMAARSGHIQRVSHYSDRDVVCEGSPLS